MNASTLLAVLDGRGIRLAARAGKLLIDAPRGAVTDEDLAALRAGKAALLALLSRGGTPDPLADRLGPALDDDAPGIDVPRNWRWAVACWPHDRWSAWRRRAGELQPPSPTVEQIRAAEFVAYVEMSRATLVSTEPD